MKLVSLLAIIKLATWLNISNRCIC